jgi:hypothetical protein
VTKESAEGTATMRNLEAIQANRPERTTARTEPIPLGKGLSLLSSVCALGHGSFPALRA